MPAVFYRDPGTNYPAAVRADGMYIHDDSGRVYLDMSGGAAVSSVGHSHPEVVSAVQDQLATLAFAHTAFFTNEPQEQLATRVAARFPEAGAKVWFTSGGSEANESALKIAWQYWRAKGKPDKTIVISRQFSYHGGTFGATSISGSVYRRAPYEKVLLDWPRIAPCYPYRHQQAGESDEDYGLRAAKELEKTILQVGADNVAAFIAEPVVGATLGVVPPAPGYFEEIRRICDENEVLLIADEVMCGSGRCGTFFTHTQEGITADMVSLAKGLGGGYQPLGAILTRGEIMATIRDSNESFAHGHTYIGHPTACAAGVAVQDCFDDGLLDAVSDKGDRLIALLKSRFGNHPHVGEIRGRGLFVGLEFVLDRETKSPFPAEASVPPQMKKAVMKHGLICYPGGGSVDGRAGAHMLIAPPFIAEDDHFAELADKLDAIFADVFD